jgi:hypothetical protein
MVTLILERKYKRKLEKKLRREDFKTDFRGMCASKIFNIFNITHLKLFVNFQRT